MGLFSVMYNDQPFETVLRNVSNLGYEAIELPAWRGTTHMDLERVISGGAQELKSLVGKYNITISALNNSMESQLVLGPFDHSTDPIFEGNALEKEQFGISRTKKTVDAARLLDVPVVNGFIGCPNWGAWYPFPPMNEKIFEHYFRTFAEKWSEILDYFASNGIKFAHELHPQELAYNIETAEEAVKAIGGRKEFGFNFDPSHLVWQLIDPVIFIKKFGDRIYHFHLKDAELVEENIHNSGATPHGSQFRSTRGFRFRVPGWGQVPWRRIITALCEVGYDYVLSYEHEDPIMSQDDGAEKAIAFIKPLLIKKKLQKIWYQV
jgi:sugar phosphate isomerase/epimerase